MTAAATAPSAIVSGSPIPSRRTGTPTSRRSCPRSMREASQNSTSASVASASVRTVALELSRSISPSTSGPTSNPTATKTIAGVTGVPDSRREIAATPSSVSATMARDQSITSALGVAPLERCVDVVAERECHLRGALDDSRSARDRGHRLEAGDDLVARRSGRESERYGVLERVRGRIDGDRRGDAHECCGLLIDDRRCA